MPTGAVVAPPPPDWCYTSCSQPAFSATYRPSLTLHLLLQKPDRPDEMARIQACGGRVFEWGVPRVWMRDVDMPGLAMSR